MVLEIESEKNVHQSDYFIHILFCVLSDAFVDYWSN